MNAEHCDIPAHIAQCSVWKWSTLLPPIIPHNYIMRFRNIQHFNIYSTATFM